MIGPRSQEPYVKNSLLYETIEYHATRNNTISYHSTLRDMLWHDTARHVSIIKQLAIRHYMI